MIKVYAPLQMDFAANILVKKINSLGRSCERVSKLHPDKQNAWIIYNTAMAWTLPERFISYQTEQSGTHWFSDKYRERLSKSIAVWEYCAANKSEYDHKNISIVTPGVEIQPKAKKDIDLLFYGAINERRKQALRGLNCKVVNNVMGNAMQSLLARTKTVLNVHYYEPNVFEMFRANECLSHHCNFISEHSLHGVKPYKDIVKFGELHELKELIESVGEFNHDISHLDNTEQIRKALKHIPKKLFTFASNNNMITKYKLKGVSQLVFRDANRNIISITKDNITDDLVQIAIANGKAHCFEELTETKKNVSPVKLQLQPVTSTLTEAPKEKPVSLIPKESTQPVVSAPKVKGKPGRKPKESKPLTDTK